MVELLKQHRLGKALSMGIEVGAVIALLLMIFELWGDRHAVGFGVSNLLECFNTF